MRSALIAFLLVFFGSSLGVIIESSAVNQDEKKLDFKQVNVEFYLNNFTESSIAIEDLIAGLDTHASFSLSSNEMANVNEILTLFSENSSVILNPSHENQSYVYLQEEFTFFDNCNDLIIDETVCRVSKDYQSYYFTMTYENDTGFILEYGQVDARKAQFSMIPQDIDWELLAKEESNWIGVTNSYNEQFDVCMKMSDDRFFSSFRSTDSTGSTTPYTPLIDLEYSLNWPTSYGGHFGRTYFSSNYEVNVFDDYSSTYFYSQSLSSQYDSFILFGVEHGSSPHHSSGDWCVSQSADTGLGCLALLLFALCFALVISRSRRKDDSTDLFDEGRMVSTESDKNLPNKTTSSPNSIKKTPRNTKSSEKRANVDVKSGFKVAGNLAKSAGSIFQGMHQLQRGNLGGAFKSFSNAASNPLSGTTKFEQAEIGDQSVSTIGKSTYTCQNPACNYQFANVSDAKMIGNTPERCPSCNTPVMKDMPWNGENPVQNSISDLGKVTYACMQPTCAYEVGPVPKGTSVGRCMNCGGPMKKKSVY